MSIYQRSLLHGIGRVFSLPRLSLPLIVTLGLTLAAVLSVIAIVSVLLFQPLPGIKDEENLHSFSMRLKISDSLQVSYFTWRRVADFQQSFADHGLWGAIRADEGQVSINDVAYPVTYYDASSNILDVLGTPLLIGQGTDKTAPEKSIWISHSLWQQAFSGRESALGETIIAGDKSYILAGVIRDISAVDSEQAILPQQIWLITEPEKLLAQEDTGNIDDSVTQLLLRSNGAGLPDKPLLLNWFDNYLKTNFDDPRLLDFVKSKPLMVENSLYRDSLVQDSKSLVLILFAAVIGLLVMASLNLLNLFIAHYQGRSKEFAIQLSLGASLTRLRAMIILENLPSFMLAAVLGLLVAGWALRGLPVIAGETLPLLDMLALNPVTIILAFVIVTALAVIFSLVALLDVNKHALTDTLNSSGKGIAAQNNQGLSRLLMIVQLSLATVLLTASVMLAKQSYDIVYQDLGYRLNNSYELSWEFADEAWAASLGEFEEYAGSEYQQLQKELAASLASLLPGSEVVTTATSPLSSQININVMMDPKYPEQILFLSREFSENYFTAFDIEFLAGKEPSRQQIEANERVIVIDERMAQKVFPGQDYQQIIGKTLMTSINSDDVPSVIIGIVGNTLARAGSLDEFIFPNIYTSPRMVTGRLRLTVLMPEGENLEPAAIEQALKQQFPRLIDLRVQSLADRWDEQTLEQRLSLAVILTMTGLTLFLAVIGVGGLTQLTTNQKRYELAVRMATGAKQAGLLKIIFKEALWMLVIGLSLGFVLSVFGYTQVKEQVSMMPGFDWQTMLVLDLALVMTVLAAVALPAWRIIKADPMQALREL
ncbi:ABC transporter permease [Thalassomonas viridans]|uniref:ABC transporter permease n=1 Tax=Thalassomonas viridans TaxID=137584 RepID=A0AAF0C675_9GAMM|nr:FtsX-like permease family protein [Thalassomonas viridans]WDE04077.1 ABC transporter permease [Thalassomonas viridans]